MQGYYLPHSFYLPGSIVAKFIVLPGANEDVITVETVVEELKSAIKDTGFDFSMPNGTVLHTDSLEVEILKVCKCTIHIHSQNWQNITIAH